MSKIFKISLILTAAITAFIGLYFGGVRLGNNSEAQTGLSEREINRINSAVDLTSEDINEVIDQTRKLLKKPGITEDEIAQIESSLSRSIQVFYRKNLKSIIAKLSSRELVGSQKAAYQTLASKNLRADISKSYANKLESILLSSSQIRPESHEFQALIYLERELALRGKTNSLT
jgi:hypothetical protein